MFNPTTIKYRIVELKDTKKNHRELQHFEIQKFITIDHKTYHTVLAYFITSKQKPLRISRQSIL